jgi:predicted RNA-binding protein YlxR (DUF448 family)
MCIHEVLNDEFTRNVQNDHRSYYVCKSISALQIQVATPIFELSAGNSHR